MTEARPRPAGSCGEDVARPAAPARRLGCIAFTRAGEELAERVVGALVPGALGEGSERPWRASVTGCYGEGHEPLGRWVDEHFAADDALLFVGATGIAVRAIARHVQAKTSDPAVLVMDEGGRWVVSLLSGHIGGANRLAELVAAAAGATPVITTATDNRGLWAVDTWATRLGLVIKNPHAIKNVSSALLAGRTVRAYSAGAWPGEVPGHVELVADPRDADVVLSPWTYDGLGDGVLRLVPRTLSVGVGCRRDTPAEVLEEAWAEVARGAGPDGAGVDEQAVCAVGSIDLKADEAGLLEFCANHGWTLETYPAERLREVTGAVSHSSFVASVTGVDNVCERAALVGGGRIVVPKRPRNGTTFAIALREVGEGLSPASPGR